ncbi:MAG: hypothetical protein IKE60_26370 [Reyranella sp.]|uniref:portal protein n=1 Tax=Reyranella sp. TaxID=1929291 RepID=UPI0025CE5404|nr:hypothetical protein [Reyranella sp.]MBR2818215.1 hypothetical protein [Reyranella sp.]
MDGFVFRDTPDRVPNSGASSDLVDHFGFDELISEMEQGQAGDPPVDLVEEAAPSDPRMSDEDFSGALRAAASDAEDYIDSFIGPMRAAATAYYRGDLFGNEEQGRSQVVMTEFRDSVLSVVPSLLRVFVGGEHPVEFIPQNAQSIDLAEQQTDYVNYVFMNDNPGFLILHSMMKDALTRKTGIVKWRWSKDKTVTETAFQGLMLEQVAVLQQDPTVQIIDLAEIQTEIAPPPEMQGQAPISVPTFDVRIRREIPKNQLVVECIPPEEWLINRDARDANDERGYTFQAHRSIKTVSEIVAMGYDESEIIENMGGSSLLENNLEQIARNPAVSGGMGYLNTPDETMHRCLFLEAYMRVDRDGDGFAELRKIHAIGTNYHVLHDEVVDEAPFAVFCPDPEPHMVIGNCIADQTMDLQRIKSSMVRSTLDSAASSIHPRTVILEGKVNADDALNTEQGAVIRAREAGAVQELTKPFLGPQMLSLLAYVDEIKAKRTGISAASQGLNPEILQSTTQAAVSATVSGAQERIEMYARIFAETALRRMFRGIAKTLRENQDQERIVKLRGKWVAVDPRSWIGELECIPNVSMGRGTDQEKLQFLAKVLEKQELIIEKLGPVNPIAGIDRYRETLAQIITLAGFKDATKYIGTVTPEFMQQMQQPKPPQPADILAQAEMMKVQADIQLKLMKFHQEAYEAAMADQREREKTYMDTMAKLAATDAQYDLNPNQALIDSLLQHEAQLAEIQSVHTAQLQKNLLQAETQLQGMAMKAQAAPAQPTPQPAPPLGPMG